jgi:hypothetical protein
MKMQIAGKPVKDSRKRLTIHITKNDVEKGDVKDPGACAAARCIKRELGVKDVRVHIGRTYVDMGDHWLRYRTSKGLRTEIVAFDRGGSFEPGEYDLVQIPPQDQFDHKRKKAPGPKIARRKIARHIHVTAGVRERGANR